MPEGDTVWRTCQRLNDVLAGRTLTRSEFRVPRLAATDLAGVAVREVVSRGKHQLFRLGNELTLHTHFRMDGTWRIFPHGRKWSGGPEFEVRAVLATKDHQAVGYRLPVIELVPTADEDSVVGHLGPDLLGPDWDLDEAVRRTATQPERSIGEALLDQRNLAGIGNLWKSEACFDAGVDPWRRLEQVADAEAVAVVRAARNRMSEPARQGWQERGAQVYDRAGRPCRRCGVRIRARGQGEDNRTTFWCPGCQE